MERNFTYTPCQLKEKKYSARTKQHSKVKFLHLNYEELIARMLRAVFKNCSFYILVQRYQLENMNILLHTHKLYKIGSLSHFVSLQKML